MSEQERRAGIAADKTGTGFIYQMFLQELERTEYIYTDDASPAVVACGLTWEKIIMHKPLITGLKKAMKTLAEDYA